MTNPHPVEWLTRYEQANDGLWYVADQAVVMSDGTRREMGPPPERGPGMMLGKTGCQMLGIEDSHESPPASLAVAHMAVSAAQD